MEIEKGIKKPSRSKYPFDKMEIGDSVMLKGIGRAAVYSAFTRFYKNNNEVKLSARKAEGGFRVWRIK